MDGKSTRAICTTSKNGGCACNILLKPDLTHEQYINAIIKAADNHYFYPLVEYSNNIIKVNKPDKKLEVLAIKLLNYARFHNFIPAIESLLLYEGKHKRHNGKLYQSYLSQGVTIGSNHAWRINLLDTLDNKSLLDHFIYCSKSY